MVTLENFSENRVNITTTTTTQQTKMNTPKQEDRNHETKEKIR